MGRGEFGEIAKSMNPFNNTYLVSVPLQTYPFFVMDELVRRTDPTFYYIFTFIYGLFVLVAVCHFYTFGTILFDSLRQPQKKNKISSLQAIGRINSPIVEELLLESYSYKTVSHKRYQYNSGNTNYFWSISPVDGASAVIRFFSSSQFNQPIDIPQDFTLDNLTTGRTVVPYGNFPITWSCDYALSHNGTEVWKLMNQKQQHLKVNSRIITTGNE
jgi:hypothetical protein